MPKVFTLSAILKDLYCVHHFYCETEDKLSISDFRKQEESEVAAQIPEQDSGMVSRELIFTPAWMLQGAFYKFVVGPVQQENLIPETAMGFYLQLRRKQQSQEGLHSGELLFMGPTGKA